MVRRGPDEGKAERHVHRLVEGQSLDGDEGLIVIHAQRRIVTAPRPGVEHGVGGVGAASLQAFGAQGGDGRGDDGLVFRAQRALFPGMRVEPGDCETRAGDAEARRKIAGDDAAGLDDQLRGQRRRHGRERYVDGNGHNGEIFAPQHHHRMGSGCAGPGREGGQVFRMPRVGEARLVEDVLGDRVGDDGGARTVPGEAHRKVYGGDDARRPARGGDARLGLDLVTCLDDGQRPVEPAGGILRRRDLDGDVEREPGGKALHEGAGADEGEGRQGRFPAPQPGPQRDLGADARGIALCQREDLACHVSCCSPRR